MINFGLYEQEKCIIVPNRLLFATFNIFSINSFSYLLTNIIYDMLIFLVESGTIIHDYKYARNTYIYIPFEIKKKN